MPLVRPLNYPEGTPGRGIYQHDGLARRQRDGPHIHGRHRSTTPSAPWTRRSKNCETAAVIILDFHAEATSEKIAMGYYLDGRVSAVVGTHTHVPTSDTRILPERYRLRDRPRDGAARCTPCSAWRRSA